MFPSQLQTPADHRRSGRREIDISDAHVCEYTCRYGSRTRSGHVSMTQFRERDGLTL